MGMGQSLPLSLHQHRLNSKRYYGLRTKDNFIILEKNESFILLLITTNYLKVLL